MTEPVEVDLSSLYPGVKVRLKRLTTMDQEQAWSVARSILAEAEKGLSALTAYGLDGSDANGVRLSPFSLEQMTGVGYLVGCVEVCLIGILSWEGVTIDDGSPAPISRETLSLLLQDNALCRRLMEELTQAARILIVEGKDLAGSQDGSSATRPKMTEGQPIAETVQRAASPAPAASQPPPGATARKSKMRP